MKIGLTGSIACGKSTVSAYLRELGYPVVDADAISHALTAPGGAALPALREAFGDSVFCGAALDRGALGRLVFADPVQRERLNRLLHPRIIAEVERRLCAYSGESPLVFADVPLLYECGMAPLFDSVWVVSAPRSAQLARLLERDGLTQEEAARRIDAQMPLARKEVLADAVIDTSGPQENTRRQVDALLTSARQRRKA